MAELFHLQMNLIFILFGKFWGVANHLVSLNWYNSILKCKHITKQSDNNNFQQIDDFFHVVIKAMVIILYIRIASCSIINKLQTWISKSNWPSLINKAKCNFLGVFKIYDIQDKAF